MRAPAIAIIVPLVWLARALASAAGDPRAALEGGTRDEKVAALVSLEQSPRVSADLVRPLGAFVRAEIARLEKPPARAASPERIPLADDETVLERLQAEPARFAGKKFRVVGTIRVSDVYRDELGAAARTHYSLALTPLDERGKKAGEVVHAYLPRSYGRLLIEPLAARPPSSRSPIVRLEVTPLAPDPRHWNLLVATDWQFLQGDSWSPWEFAGLRAAFRVLPKLGRAAVPLLVELLSEDAPDRPPELAETLHAMCLGTLLNMEARERRQAAALLDRELARAASDAQRTSLRAALAELRKSLAR
jgi:hypothetical protein